MAYMSQEKKKLLAPAIKSICKKYKVKATISVQNYSTLCLNIKSGPLDFIGNWADNLDFQTLESQAMMKIDSPEAEKEAREKIKSSRDHLSVNNYWLNKNYSGEVFEFLVQITEAMMDGNHDNSDIMTDYFDVGWYIDINVGKWDNPYDLVA